MIHSVGKPFFGVITSIIITMAGGPKPKLFLVTSFRGEVTRGSNIYLKSRRNAHVTLVQRTHNNASEIVGTLHIAPIYEHGLRDVTCPRVRLSPPALVTTAIAVGHSKDAPSGRCIKSAEGDGDTDRHMAHPSPRACQLARSRKPIHQFDIPIGDIHPLSAYVIFVTASFQPGSLVCNCGTRSHPGATRTTHLVEATVLWTY